MKFLRYPGGKSKLLDFISQYLPSSYDIKGKYIEPFVGGGAVFFFIQPPNAILADVNLELIDLYRGIKMYPNEVWDIFQSFPSGKKSYYKIRDDELDSQPLYYRAARTLYLNRTCFKGMWRHNSKGDFNVGYGGEERRWVIDHQNILTISDSLCNANIIQADFSETFKNIRDGDFVFLDPPYKPGDRELHELHYGSGRFTFSDQQRLAEEIFKVSNNYEFKWLMTNSDHNDLHELYKDYRITKIPKGTSGTIGVHTKKSQEIIISNY